MALSSSAFSLTSTKKLGRSGPPSHVSSKNRILAARGKNTLRGKELMSRQMSVTPLNSDAVRKTEPADLAVIRRCSDENISIDRVLVRLGETRDSKR